MQRFERLEAYMDRLVDRCSRRFQHTRHDERPSLMQVEAGADEAMRDRQLRAYGVAEFARHFRAEYRFGAIAETCAARKSQGRAATETVTLEIVGARAQHAVASMRIAERKGDAPRHARIRADALEAVPAHRVAGVADAEHGIQQQVQLARARTDDEVYA